MRASENPPLRVAAIGCGNVALRRYFPYLTADSDSVDLVACADVDDGRARQAAARFGLRLCTHYEALNDATIDIILNLTPPLAHWEINSEALHRGKHVYSEKPFALSHAEGSRLQELADSAGRRIASAPDTILGPNIQLARQLIVEGRIGRPLMASMSFVTSNRDWHPDPEFFYRRGAGPIFDEAPYFLTALVALLGPVREVFARAATYRREMEVATGPRRGARYRPEVPTSYVGGLVLESGAMASLLMSFDVPGTTMPPLEIYGDEGTLRLAFPGFYTGPILFGRAHDHITKAIYPSWRPAMEEARGIGLEEFGRAVRMHVPSRLEGAFPLHMIEIMEALERAAQTERSEQLVTRTDPPAPYDPNENPRNVHVQG